MKYSWELDKFDSEIFGFKVAKIQRLEEGSVKGLIKDLIKNKIKYATFRVQSNNFVVIHALERAGFILVDGLISLRVDISNLKLEDSDKSIRKGENYDLQKLNNLTSGLFSTRVMHDSFISKNRANKFYIKWIENSILGKAADFVLVWDEKDPSIGRQGKILGFATLQKKGQIPLVGVSVNARGRGIGRKLIKASLNKFKEWGVEIIVIETQNDNIAALNLYQTVGFKIVNSFLTLRWAEND